MNGDCLLHLEECISKMDDEGVLRTLYWRPDFWRMRWHCAISCATEVFAVPIGIRQKSGYDE